MRAWAAFPKLYLSTLTKPFASGLKVGYAVCTDPDWRARMLHVKGHHDFGSANFNQAICEHVLANGAFDAQLARIRPAYESKMRALHEALEREGLRKLGWHWEVPEGGLYLWLRAPAALDTGLESRFCHACIEAGVLYVTGDHCFGDDPPRNHARLSFGVLAEPELAVAAQRFVAVARRFGG
jgi:2-aminoadipate transaminase